ncbi:cysteine-rich CWC family protein [Shewanella sp. Isolate13]|uniref:cysteine-rich CWC family protein n=1 Tax=Shewanella sp. Isolate13 TaxID=2908531 RepID=UPI001EFC9524|nr:cysteine-rich CWC family protein [Shewanella sp. Isolate13]MCG9728351.1 cysteine-rich CWC family protein [Shewanella sp. Isolate13]
MGEQDKSLLPSKDFLFAKDTLFAKGFADANHCPLCKGLNRCAAETGASIEQCWCSKQEFPDSALLAQVLDTEELAGLNGNACICEVCLQRLQLLQAQGRTLYKRID